MNKLRHKINLQNINDTSPSLISEDSIDDFLNDSHSNQQLSQSEELISRLTELSNTKGNEHKEKFVRKRNRSRSTLVTRTPPNIPKLEELPIIINRTRSNSDPQIKNNTEKRSMFSFKSNN